MNRAFAATADVEFHVLIMDTACNRLSMMSLSQHRAFCQLFVVMARMDTPKSRTINGIGNSKVSSMGTATIPIPFPKLRITPEIKF